jgi:integrase
MPLTDAKLRSLKPGPKATKIADGGGLHIVVTPNGSKLWRLAYRFGGKQKVLALGAFPDVSLAEARKAREAARELLAKKEDPAQARKVEERREKLEASQTFRAVADEWFAARRRRWVASYSTRLRSRLDADLLPHLGDRPINTIEPIEVLDVIRRIEQREAVEMAKRVMQMASAIFRYGVATSRCARDPTADLRGALQMPGPVKHRSALSAAELPEFLELLDAYEGEDTTKLALRLILLTFVRTSEVRFAKWSEFEDLDGPEPLWRIPAERMKMRRPHLVPLAPQAVEVLRELRRWAGQSAWLLPAPTRSGVLSENTLIYSLYRLGYHGRATVHGFRSTASTILNEHQFNRDWIELQLAHVEGSVRAIYNAAEWLPGRRDMMCWWADYLDAAAAGSAAPIAAPVNAPTGRDRPAPGGGDWRAPRSVWTPTPPGRGGARRRGGGRA